MNRQLMLIMAILIGGYLFYDVFTALGTGEIIGMLGRGRIAYISENPIMYWWTICFEFCFGAFCFAAFLAGIFLPQNDDDDDDDYNY